MRARLRFLAEQMKLLPNQLTAAVRTSLKSAPGVLGIGLASSRLLLQQGYERLTSTCEQNACAPRRSPTRVRMRVPMRRAA